ncbi:MAG: hypothetical protein DBX45_01170 [Oscillospiraceae bacterium]|nr:MAG: hypothetical protein DBX45_01170 [Oscillospiraceae bacterium]
MSARLTAYYAYYDERISEMKLLEIYRKCRDNNINKLHHTDFSAFAAERDMTRGSMTVENAAENNAAWGDITAKSAVIEASAAGRNAACGITTGMHSRRREDRRSGGSTVAARVVCCICTLVLLFSACTGIRALGVDAELYDRILRLHVIADSDSDADQAVKLKVRDAVLKLLGDEMETSPDLEQARTAAERLMPEAERVARQVLRDSGFSYGATVTLGYEYYPTRDYGGFRLPAGRYLSYRIVLGSGEGHNWWCVLFPALCTAPAERQEDEFVTAGFTPGQIGVLSGKKSPKYAVRFRILELLGELEEKLK